MCVFIGNILVDFLNIKIGRGTLYCVVHFPENCIGRLRLYMYTYADLTYVYVVCHGQVRRQVSQGSRY